MARAAILPPIIDEDRIPHDCAVWRDGACEAGVHIAICVEYDGGAIARTYVGAVPDWTSVRRWRFGWPPR